jgi:hypothetical protein
MAQDIVLRILDRDGDTTVTRREVVTVAQPTNSVTHQAFSLAANVKTSVSFGGVGTADLVYVERLTGSGTIEVYRNLSPESWQMEDLFFVLGTSITALALEASEATTVWIHIAGS